MVVSREDVLAVMAKVWCGWVGEEGVREVGRGGGWWEVDGRALATRLNARVVRFLLVAVVFQLDGRGTHLPTPRGDTRGWRYD